MQFPRDKDGRISADVVDAAISALSKHARLSPDEAESVLRKIEQATYNRHALNDPKPFLGAKAY